MDDQFGYNFDFVHDDIPDDLKCVVCHLVMRHPIQIMACGHRLCKSCMQRIEAYAVHLNTPLLCPFDREVVDMRKVFDDTAVSRSINNLEVKCFNASKGCAWIGRLGSLQAHDETCEFKQNQLTLQQDNSIVMKTVEELSVRFTKLEEMFIAKEKEVSCLSHNIERLNERCKKQEKEIIDVKKENADLKVAITTNGNIPQIEHLKIGTNQKLNMIQLKFDKNAEDIAALKQDNPNYTDRLKKIDNDVIYLSNQLRRKENEETHRGRIDSLKEKCNNIEDQVENVGSVKKRFDELYTDYHENKKEYGNMKKQFEDLQNGLKTVSNKNDEVEKHVINLENLQFLCSSSTELSNECLIQWKMVNFQSHTEKGGNVYSPVFDTSIEGYAFQLNVRWTDQKDFMKLYMKLHRSKYCVKQLKLFNIPFRLEMVANDGTLKYCKVSDETTFEKYKTSFEIPDGSDSANNHYGFSKFIGMDEINQFVVNDTITIQCRFYLQ